jgi:hypothetical protein
VSGPIRRRQPGEIEKQPPHQHGLLRRRRKAHALRILQKQLVDALRLHLLQRLKGPPLPILVVTTLLSFFGFFPAISGAEYGAPSSIHAAIFEMASAGSFGLLSGMCGSLAWLICATSELLFAVKRHHHAAVRAAAQQILTRGHVEVALHFFAAVALEAVFLQKAATSC